MTTRRVPYASPKPCSRCTHAHQGPCYGRSPFGGYSCPCGHEKKKSERFKGAGICLSGEGKHSGGVYERVLMHDCGTVWLCDGCYLIRESRVTDDDAAAGLLANLAREKVPPRREVKQAARYAAGASLDWWEL